MICCSSTSELFWNSNGYPLKIRRKPYEKPWNIKSFSRTKNRSRVHWISQLSRCRPIFIDFIKNDSRSVVPLVIFWNYLEQLFFWSRLSLMYLINYMVSIHIIKKGLFTWKQKHFNVLKSIKTSKANLRSRCLVSNKI